jgi:hypothetical protein
MNRLRNTVSSRILALVVCAAVLSTVAAAQGQSQNKGQSKGQGQGKAQEQAQSKSQARQGQSERDENGYDRGDARAPRRDRATTRRRAVVLSPSDQSAVRDYYRHSSGLPPGLAKRGGDLPPGLRKQLQRNGTLPPGLQQRLQPLSPELERRLSPLPRGDSRFIRCESHSTRRTYCWADSDGGVRMTRQLSDAACSQGSTWGQTDRGIWVSHGCRADFEVLPVTYSRGLIGSDLVVVENRTQRILDVFRDVVR